MRINITKVMMKFKHHISEDEITIYKRNINDDTTLKQLEDAVNEAIAEEERK